MNLSNICICITALFCFLILSACTSSGGKEYQTKIKEVETYGLRAPESWEIHPYQTDMHWNNMLLRNVCAELTKIGREPNMVMWEVLLWTEVRVDESCGKFLRVKDEAKQLASRIKDDGRTDEMSKVCHLTDRRVIDLVTGLLGNGTLGNETRKGMDRLAACAKLQDD